MHVARQGQDRGTVRSAHGSAPAVQDCARAIPAPSAVPGYARLATYAASVRRRATGRADAWAAARPSSVRTGPATGDPATWVALEPTTGKTDRLDECAELDCARVLAPKSTANWSLEIELN